MATTPPTTMPVRTLHVLETIVRVQRIRLCPLTAKGCIAGCLDVSPSRLINPKEALITEPQQYCNGVISLALHSADGHLSS